MLLRFLVHSEADKAQNKIAARLFQTADEIIIPTHVFCELVWVLLSLYKVERKTIETIIEQLLNSDPKLNISHDEVEAGLKMFAAGGDFADGVNAYTGRKMAQGQAVFVSFDKKAVRLLSQQSIAALSPH